MMSMTAYLVPHSALRGRQLPRSDTLFGALCCTFRLLFGAARLEELLRAFTPHTAPFVLSSMFAYTRAPHATHHYLPKPLGEPYRPPAWTNAPPTCREHDALRRLNAMRVVSDTDFSDIVHGRKTDSDLYEACVAHGDQPLAEECPGVNAALAGHVAANRLTGGPDAIFFTEEWMLDKPEERAETGLFFCLRCRDDFVKEMKAAIMVLADTGIGGGRSAGRGQFSAVRIVDGLPYQEPPDEESAHVVTLSLTSPDDALKGLLAQSWYRLERRQGRIDALYAPSCGHARKDALLMLCEGSTFPRHERQRRYGMNRIVRQAGDGIDFDVYQYGCAFTVNTRHILSVSDYK